MQQKFEKILTFLFKVFKVVDRVGIMEKLLEKFNNLMRQDGQNVSLFPSNAPVHSDS